MSKQALSKEPFPGLRPFKTCEDYLFFGRDEQVYTMVDRLESTRFLTVIGVSGSGKSSLVNCGLRPALHRGYMSSAGSRWRIATARPGSDPVKNLVDALKEDASLTLDETILRDTRIDEQGRKQGGFFNAFSRVASGQEEENLLLVIDQFEEVFRYMDQGVVQLQEAHSFIDLLLEVRRQRTYPVYVAMSMRSDFLGECAQFDGLPQAINEGLFLIPRLNEAERRAVIRGPIKVVDPDIDIEHALLERLATELGDKPDQLTVLQHALNRTWHYWKQAGRKGPIGIAHYEQAGKIDQAINQHAGLVYSELKTDRERLICQTLFRALTERGDDYRSLRRPMAFGPLCNLADATVKANLNDTTPVTSDECEAIIRRFWQPGVNFLYVSTDSLDDCDEEGEAVLDLHEDTFVDISHENLMEQWEDLSEWIDEEAEAAHMLKSLSEKADRYKAGKADLLRGLELQLAMDWHERQRPTPEWTARYGYSEQVVPYLEESQALRDQELKQEVSRRRRQLIVANVMAALMMLVAGTTFWAMQRTINEKRALESAEQTANLFSAMLAEANPNIRLRYEPSASAYDTLTVFDLVDRAEARILRELTGQPDIQAQMLNVIGDVYEQLGDYDTARDILERSYAIRDSLSGTYDEQTARSINSLGNVLMAMDSLESAIPTLQEALDIRRDLLGRSHPDVAESLNDLALALSLQGDSLDRAESLFDMALEIRRAHREDDANDLAETLNNLGTLYYDRGEYDEARSLLQEAIDVRTEYYGGDHPLLAGSLNNLSVLLQNQADDLYDAAYNLAVEADSIAAFDSVQAVTLTNDSDELYLIADSLWSEAGNLAQQTFEMSERLLGDEHIEVGVAHFNLALIRWGELEYEISAGHFEEASRVFQIRERYGYLALAYSEWGNMLLQTPETCSTADSILQKAIALADPPANLGYENEEIIYAEELLGETCP